MEECGLFDEELLAAEDIELFGRICVRWKVARVPEVLMVRTEGTHNITANGRKMNDYSILAFEKIIDREPDLPPSVRRTLDKELGRQHWWRGYLTFKNGSPEQARTDLWRAIQYDKGYLRAGSTLILASFLPRAIVNRLQARGRSRKVNA